MKNFYDWIRLQETNQFNPEVIDPKNYNKEMFTPPFKPPLQATSPDEIPPNYLKDSPAYEIVREHVDQGYAIMFQNLEKFEHSDDRMAYGEAQLLFERASQFNAAIPHLEKNVMYGPEQQGIKSAILLNYQKYDVMKKMYPTKKPKYPEIDEHTSAYHNFSYGYYYLRKLLDEYKKSGYGHAVRMQSPLKPQ